MTLNLLFLVWCLPGLVMTVSLFMMVKDDCHKSPWWETVAMLAVGCVLGLFMIPLGVGLIINIYKK